MFLKEVMISDGSCDILICWFAIQETFLIIIINTKKVLLDIFVEIVTHHRNTKVYNKPVCLPTKIPHPL